MARAGAWARLLLKHLLFSREKQTRSVERHIRKMEFHISKVSQLPGAQGGVGVVSVLAGSPLGSRSREAPLSRGKGSLGAE